MRLAAFVFMPEHIHMLVYPVGNTEPDLGHYLKSIKQPFSKCIKKLLKASGESLLLNELMVQERPGKQTFRFWQEGPGFDRNLFMPKVIESSINYIHNNPVKRGLCEKAIDWPWSSARYYLDELPCRQHSQLPYIHGVPPEALDPMVRYR